MRLSRYLLLVMLVASPVGARMMGGGMMGSEPVENTDNPAGLDAPAREGYDLTRRYCSQCHAVPDPKQHTAAEWSGVMKRMQRYMHQQGRPLPGDGDEQKILRYLGKDVPR